jgi:hypothetical protein
MSEFIKICLDNQGSITNDNNSSCELSFYGVDPNISPIPPDMDMICVVNSSAGNTISVSNLYDVYDNDKKCIKFLAWLEPIENTIPLYIYQKPDNSVYVDLKPNNTYKPLYFSPIHVIQDTNIKFIYFRGRCIPSKTSGSSLNECMKKVVSCVKDKPTILNLLESRYGNLKHNNNNHSKIIYVLAMILIIFCFYLIYKLGVKKYKIDFFKPKFRKV